VREYVRCPGGLQPRPMLPTLDNTEQLQLFRFLGRLVAKALMDGRLLDLPLSPVMWKAVLVRDLSISDLSVLDPKLGSTMMGLLEVAKQYEAIAACSERSAEEKAAAQADLTYQGASIEDLCLDMTLPGRPDVELQSNGAEVVVTVHNLKDYVTASVQSFLHDGVAQQLDEFRQGFDEIFPLESLRLFTSDEIELLVCGHGGSWDPQDFIEDIRCDRGYTKDSKAIRNLAEILAELDPVDQRLFLRFATGTPRLPADGLKGLNPPLTVVLKPPEPGCSADDYLPSVMTCTNYLKLPDYSTKEVMKAKLVTAIKEGHVSFHLS